MSYIKGVEKSKGHEHRIVTVEPSDDSSCLICGSRDVANVRHIKFNRKYRGDNIITFSICDACLKELKRDVLRLK